jgi:soluble lytic murein transglycosylase-like protein
MEALIGIGCFIIIAIVVFPKNASGGTGTGGVISLDSIIRKYSLMRYVPFEILKAVVWKESEFNSNAINDERKIGDPSDDAHGLMQIRAGALKDFNQATGHSYTMQDLFNQEININVGSWYLAQLIRRNGTEIGVMMYNTGEQGYKNGVRNEEYASLVLARSEQYA